MNPIIEEAVRIHIEDDEDDNSKKSSESQDREREEQPWTDKSEKFIRKIQQDCLNKAQAYDKASRDSKKKYTRYALPGVVVPIVMSVVSPHLPVEYKYIDGISLASIAVLNGLSTFFNFGKKFSQYSEYNGKYSDLASYIEVELSKPKRFRVAADIFLERCSVRIADLNNNAPFL